MNCWYTFLKVVPFAWDFIRLLHGADLRTRARVRVDTLGRPFRLITPPDVRRWVLACPGRPRGPPLLGRFLAPEHAHFCSASHGGTGLPLRAVLFSYMKKIVVGPNLTLPGRLSVLSVIVTVHFFLLESLHFLADSL